MNLCRKCEKEIPWVVEIEGKKRNLQTRKYCLDCSPFGKHNTKSNIDSKGTKVKIKWCELTQKQRDRYCFILWMRGMDRKKKLIELKGGKCERCGYNKCIQALEFHHRNPKDKEFVLAQTQIRARPWAVVLEESNKCDLLCANCHAEHHASTPSKYQKELDDWNK